MTNKILFVGALIACFGGVFFWTQAISEPEDTVGIPIGFGKPTETKVDMHIAVGILVPQRDPPKLKHNILQWDEWVSDHYSVSEVGGETLTLRRTGNSRLIAQPGTPEFFIYCVLKPGRNYTLTHTPILAEGKTYEYTFVAPTDVSESKIATLRPAP